MDASEQPNIKIVKINDLKPAVYNPRFWSKEATKQLSESIERFGVAEPILANSNSNRHNIVIGGHFRLKVAKDLGLTEVPVVYIDIPEEQRERELNLRLNKNTGSWDMALLAEFDQSLLADVGFDNEELGDIFEMDIELDKADSFNLDDELNKLDIKTIAAMPGDVYQLGDSRLMVGDSTIAVDVHKLMNGQLADMILTDPPYLADYKNGVRRGKPVTDHGTRRNRRYLETEELPDDFTQLWMANAAKHTALNCSIIVYEAWQNVRTIWAEVEKYFTVKNLIINHQPDRHQGFAAKHKFFSKYDIALAAAKGTVEFNGAEEADGLHEEYDTALFAISGKPYWETYKKGKSMPTDFIEYQPDDRRDSGQGVVFGTKPLPVLIPYIKVLTKPGDLLVDLFCGSGSTLIAATLLKRRCYLMEKSPVYAEVALRRWEKQTGSKRRLVVSGVQNGTQQA